jgi:proliferating cell nuclear antigen
MKLALAGDVLGKAVKAVSGLIPEATLTVDKEGLRVLDMDPSNVAMVHLRIPETNFVEFDLEGKEKEEISLQLTDITPILKRITKDDIVSLTLIENARLKLSFSGKNYEVPLIDIEGKEQKEEPELDPKYSVTVKTRILKSLIEDASIVSEDVSFEKEPKEEFKIRAAGELKKFDSPVQVESTPKETEEKVSSKYAIEYLNKMVNTSFATAVTLSFATDYPLAATFQNDNFSVKFILAPRVESE